MRYKLIAILLLTVLGLTAGLLSPVAAVAVSTNTSFNNACAGYTVNSDDPSNPPPAACQDIARQQHCNSAKGTANACEATNPIISIIKAAIRFISKVLGAAAIIGIVVSGLRLIISNGDSSAVASARSGLIYCLIGIMVALIAQIIVSYVLKGVS